MSQWVNDALWIFGLWFIVIGAAYINIGLGLIVFGVFLCGYSVVDSIRNDGKTTGTGWRDR